MVLAFCGTAHLLEVIVIARVVTKEDDPGSGCNQLSHCATRSRVASSREACSAWQALSNALSVLISTPPRRHWPYLSPGLTVRYRWH